MRDSNIENKKKNANNFKNKLFYLFHNLLLFKEIKPHLGAILIYIQFFQMLIMTMNGSNSNLSPYFFGYIVEDLDYALFYPVVHDSFNGRQRLITTIIILFSMILITASFYIFSVTQNYSQNIRVQQAAYIKGLFCEIMIKFLFVPLLGTLITVTKCDVNDVTCFSPIHLLLIACSIIGIIFLSVISYAIEAFFFDFSFKSKDSLAHAPVSDFVLGFIYKFLAVILSVGIFNIQYNTLLSLYHILFNLLFLYNSVKKVTYFHPLVHESYLVSTATIVWSNFSFVLSDLIKFSLLLHNVMLVAIAGSILFVALCRNIRSRSQRNLLTQEASELESDVLLDAKVRFFYNLSRTSKVDDSSDLLFASLIKIHIDNCPELKCPCKNRSDLYDPKTLSRADPTMQHHRDQTFIKHFMYFMLKSGVIKFINSELLFLDSVFFLYEAMRNYPMAYQLTQSYEKKTLATNPRITIQFIIYRLYYRLSIYISNKNEKQNSSVLNYQVVMEFDQNLNSLRTMISKQIEYYINLWEMIDSEYPDLSLMNKNLSSCLDQRDLINEQYASTLKINNQNQEMRSLMEIYADYICYDEELASRVNDDIINVLPMDRQSGQFDLTKGLEEWNIFDSNCFTVEISNQIDKLGQIENFSKNMPSLLGFEEGDIRFQNIKIILPKVIAIFHDRILKDFFETGRDVALRQPHHLFGVDKHGYCFSNHIIMKTLPHQGYYTIVSILRILNQHDYIILDDRGNIDSFGKKVAEILDLKPDMLAQHRINLQIFAPKILKYFHYHFQPKELDQDQKRHRSFYIFIPTNWKLALQKYEEKLRKKLNLPDGVPFGNNEYEKELKYDFDEYYQFLLSFMKRNSKKRSCKKIIKVKVEIESFSLYNQKINFKALKVISYKVKNNINELNEIAAKQEALIPKLAKRVARSIEEKRLAKAHEIELARKLQEDDDDNDDDQEREREPEEKELVRKKSGTPANVDKKRNTMFIKAVRGKVPSVIKQNMLDSPKFDSEHDESPKSSLPLNPEDSFASGRDSDDEQSEKELSQIAKASIFKPVIKRDGSNENLKSILKKKSTEVGGNGSDDDKMYAKKKSSEHQSHGSLDYEKKHSYDKKSSFDRKASLVKKKSSDIHHDDKKGPKSSEGSAEEREDPRKKKKVTISHVDKEQEGLLKKKKNTRESTTSKKNSKKIGYSNNSDSTFDDDGNFMDDYGHNSAHGSLNSIVINNNKNQGEKKKAKNQEFVDPGQASVASTATFHGAAFVKQLKYALDHQDTPMNLKITGLTLTLNVLITIIVTAVLSQVGVGQINNYLDNIQAYNTPNRYEVNLFSIYDSYTTLKYLSLGVLNSSVYDSEWLAHDIQLRNQSSSELRSLMNSQINDMNLYQELRLMYFTPREYLIQLKNESTFFTFNFEKFLKLILNAVNQTLDLPVSDYKNTNSNEFLFLLNYNFFITMSFLEEEKNFIISQMTTNFDELERILRIDELVTLGLLLVMLLIVVPVVVRSRGEIQKILTYFTRISKRDSDFYLKHYRTIRLTWNSPHDNYLNLQREVEEENRNEENAKRESKLSSISRTRRVTGLKIKYLNYIIVGLLIFGTFAGINIAKDEITLKLLKNISKYGKAYYHISDETSSAFKLILEYKLLLGQAIEDPSLVTTDMINLLVANKNYDKDSAGILDPLPYYEDYGVSSSNVEFLKNIMVGDICNLIQADKSVCLSLFSGQLKKGYSPLRNSFYSFLTNYVSEFIKIFNSGSGISEYSEYLINNPDLKGFLRSWEYFKDLFFNFLNLSYQDIYSQKDSIISTFNIILIVFCVLLMLFLTIIWRSQYNILRGRIIRTNKFFQVIPLHLIKENQHMRTYFEQQLNLKMKSF